MATRALIIDDDEALAEMLAEYLSSHGLDVVSRHRADRGLETIAAEAFDAVILDVMLPDLDGFEVCRRIRERSDVPIVMLTARGEETDRIVGLELGADDYLAKPFSPRELVARTKGILRRTQQKPPSGETTTHVIERRGLRVDVDRHACTWNGAEVALTVTEFDLLRSMLGMDGKVYTREELVSRAYGSSHHITDRTVDSHIRRIRRKFRQCGADVIETVYGLGYRLTVAPHGTTEPNAT